VAELGDVRWGALRGEHDETVRRLLAQFGGHEVEHAGDGFLATFDSAGRAVRCALAIVSELVRLQLDVRAGVHTGEGRSSETASAGSPSTSALTWPLWDHPRVRCS
jgi:class 3 adenylate cyclase